MLHLLVILSLQDVSSELGKCAAMTNDIARLQCFDNLAAKHVESSTEAPTLESGWQVQSDTNPLSDETRVSMLKMDNDQKVGLILRCDNKKVNVFINWRNYLGSEAIVTHRLGTAEPETKQWSMSTDSRATFFPGDEQSFLFQLMQVDQLVARVTPYNESPVTAIFDLSRLKDEVGPLLRACEIGG